LQQPFRNAKVTGDVKSRAWWYTPVIPALRMLKREDCKFKASPGYTDGDPVDLSQNLKKVRKQQV
jgi:hypothetical protein